MALSGLSRRRSQLTKGAADQSRPRGQLGTARVPRPVLLVLETDNEPQVRDGYISSSTSGHTRARSTRLEGAICRKNVSARAPPCPPVPPLNLHGKEGVDGSSPSEGLHKSPANGHFYVARNGEISILRGYETGTFWDWRALAGTGDVLRHSLERARETRSRPLTRKAPANRHSALSTPT